MTEKIWTAQEFQKLSYEERNGCFNFSSYKAWCKQGMLHRLDGPAVDYNNGDKFWYKEDKFHRLDGPAWDYTNGTKKWCIEGKEYTEEEFNILSFAILNGLEKFL